jgi:ribonuclease HII
MLKFHFSENLNEIEVGIDEAGRGCLLGPVYAAAVVWDPRITDGKATLIKDSKKLSAKKREELAEYIESNAIAYGVGSVDANEIDKTNILNAAIRAMHVALEQVCQKLNGNIDHVIVDGNVFKTFIGLNGDFIRHTCVVNGDNEYVSIAAASILAKVYHDKWIKEALVSYPELEKYGTATNQGYGAKKHLDAIKEHGITRFHRKSFKCCV